jgi:hypothetical protein
MVKACVVVFIGCLALLLVGCQSQPRKAGLGFKARIDAAFQTGNSAEAVKALNEMTQYKVQLKVEDESQFFSAWPEARGGYETWGAGAKLKLLQMNNEKR